MGKSPLLLTLLHKNLFLEVENNSKVQNDKTIAHKVCF